MNPEGEPAEPQRPRTGLKPQRRMSCSQHKMVINLNTAIPEQAFEFGSSLWGFVSRCDSLVLAERLSVAEPAAVEILPVSTG